jgi:uncharacterized repeat protein (TIGR03803 family)
VFLKAQKEKFMKMTEQCHRHGSATQRLETNGTKHRDAGKKANACDKLNRGTKALAVCVLFASSAIALNAQVTTLYSFMGQPTGADPAAGLVQGANGSLYGTTALGGSKDNCNEGCSTAFALSLGGTLTVLHSFDIADGDGAWALVQDPNGTFYGTASGGGTSNQGTIFKISTKGKLATLVNLNETTGIYPGAGLILGTDGNFYGMANAGGINNDGTIFKVTPTGKLTVVYNLGTQSTDGVDGWGVIQGSDGNFYGTTGYGGVYQQGTIFKMTPSGVFTTLYAFCGEGGDCDTTGRNPYGGLVEGSDGNFYGTTLLGGGGYYAGLDGTVFKITPGGTFSTLYSFCSVGGNACLDGETPQGNLILATDGNLYGTTEGGPYTGYGYGGTVFQITPGGALTTLYSFCLTGPACTDGNNPLQLVQDTNGMLYGTTGGGGGGASNDGSVFSLSIGQGPFVRTQTTSGLEGAQVGIMGQNFSAASVVKFGGVAATTITETGTTYISATVPAGALTGSVTVTTGATTLTSSQKFSVLPSVVGFTPPSGPVGTPVTITGTGLTQTTAVTFNGVAAINFTVNNDAQVTADVPIGAKTGTIAITTQGGSASSKAKFKVSKAN